MAWWVLQNVVITAALAAVVAVACRVGRIGPVFRHALWVVVLLKFVTPPLVVWPWPAPDPLGIATMGGGTDEPRNADRDLVEIGARRPSPATRALTVTPAVTADDPRGDGATRTTAAASTWSWLVALWVAGSLGFLAIEGARLARLARLVKTAHPSSPALAARVQQVAAGLGVAPVPVLTVPRLGSPILCCLGSPRLLWPQSLDPAGEPPVTGADGLLVHELAHVARRDHLVGWIELAAGVVWWWNPLFWSVRAARREEAELACDAWVTAALPDGRRAYAESLIALSIASAGRLPSESMAGAVGVRAGSRRILERRLVMIMKGRTPIRLRWAALVVLTLIAAATLPAWTAASAQQQPPAPPPPPQVIQSTQTPVPPPPPAPPAPTKVAPVPKVRVQQTTPPKMVTYAVVNPDGKETHKIVYRPGLDTLPAAVQDQVRGFETDRAAIQAETDKKVEARRELLAKSLQDLQDQYTKAGKLDEAVAIRDYVRAGMPGTNAPPRLIKAGTGRQ